MCEKPLAMNIKESAHDRTGVAAESSRRRYLQPSLLSHFAGARAMVEWLIGSALVHEASCKTGFFTTPTERVWSRIWAASWISFRYWPHCLDLMTWINGTQSNPSLR